MTVRLLMNLGTRHPVVSGSNEDLCGGSVHSFSEDVEARLVAMSHAEYVAPIEATPPDATLTGEPPKRRRRRKPETETDSNTES